MKELFLNKKFIIAFTLALSFFTYNLWLINNGHFHEDAYILFVYVENFINGYGITYYPGGEHIEGATDFLWLILLSILVKLGLDIGISVMLLNSIGVFIITYILNLHLEKNKRNTKYLLIPFTVMWIFSTLLYATVGGFSVYLYMSLVLLNTFFIQEKKYFLFTPYISLIIALFRPDGVIIAIGFTILGLHKSIKDNKLKEYLTHLIFPIVVGASYFIWRYNYFGNLLPLPLYVKNHADSLAGIGANYNWIKSNFYIIIPAFILALYTKNIKKYLYLSIPVILLFIALFVATQSQNVGYRFQGPIYIVLYYVLFKLLIEYLNSEKNKYQINFIYIFLIIIMIISGKHLYKSYINITSFNYFNQLPLELNKILPNNSFIALTEAGKMAYWNQNKDIKIIDLVGLNTVYPALNKVDISYLEKVPPDIIMYNHASLLNDILYKNLKAKYYTLRNRDLYNFKNIINLNSKSEISKVLNASLVFTNYLNKNFKAYDVFLVDSSENNSYNHIYAIKKELKLKLKFENILSKSFERDTHKSYYEMIQNK